MAKRREKRARKLDPKHQDFSWECRFPTCKTVVSSDNGELVYVAGVLPVVVCDIHLPALQGLSYAAQSGFQHFLWRNKPELAQWIGVPFPSPTGPPPHYRKSHEHQE